VLGPLYGIKTGFNEAFYIDEQQRKLILEDRASENLKPASRRDIDRWRPRSLARYMIVARRGINVNAITINII